MLKREEGCRNPRRWRAIRLTQAVLPATVFLNTALGQGKIGAQADEKPGSY